MFDHSVEMPHVMHANSCSPSRPRVARYGAGTYHQMKRLARIEELSRWGSPPPLTRAALHGLEVAISMSHQHNEIVNLGAC
jgi:hypothetical protein